MYIILQKKKKLTKKNIIADHFLRNAPPAPSAPPLTSEFPTYEISYGNYDEAKKINTDVGKEFAPYSGINCRACNFISKSNAGLNTHIKAMLNRQNGSKPVHSIYYTK